MKSHSSAVGESCATAAAIEDKLVGITTANGIKIKDFATHFIDRVIGQVSEYYAGKRCGVKIDESWTHYVPGIYQRHI